MIPQASKAETGLTSQAMIPQASKAEKASHTILPQASKAETDLIS
jgi:hypothetical protein